MAGAKRTARFLEMPQFTQQVFTGSVSIFLLEMGGEAPVALK